MDTSLDHPILGKLTFDRDVNWWAVNILLTDNCSIEFCISVEESDIDPLPMLDRAVEYLDWARKNESECRSKIAKDLLDLYNNVWADENDDDGFGQLSREKFIGMVTPKSLIFNTDNSGIWYYSDNDLFYGHSIEIFIE